MQEHVEKQHPDEATNQKLTSESSQKINQSMNMTRLENPAKKLKQGKSNGSHWQGETENQSNMEGSS